MMGAFGRFLELSIPSGDVLRSLAFYRALGFGELTTGDTRTWHYAVITDGSIVVGLHGDGIYEPALSFVRPNLARQVRSLEEAGHDFEFQRLGAEQFHEAGLRSPDGHLILMMEARTFSPGEAGGARPLLIGRCTEISLACRNLTESRAFFEAAGFLAGTEEDSAVVRLNTPGMTLGLRESARPGPPALRYEAADVGRVLRALAEKGLPVSHDPDGHVLRAPEGTRLLIG